LEAYKEPIVDTSNYKTRKGFNVKFLGLTTPFPTLTDKSLAAPMIGSASVKVPYENFTVVMHKTRRLAIYTASNVDWNADARRPDKTRPKSDYSRNTLGGLADGDVEKWVSDRRLAAEHQVPDKFYKEDAQSFDKGHIVRRDDMCWGKDYALLQRANGDTYHLTNCSPQVKGFNQSREQGLWGLLENMIQAQGKTEKYNVFAGPILAADDRFFNGKSDNGPLRLQIPTAFWKVVVFAQNGKLKATAFVLEQDLSDVPPGVEFVPTGQFIHKTISLKKLEQRVKLVRFPKVLHDGDQNA
jgi:endonuclease G